MAVCQTCNRFDTVNLDPYGRELPLLNPLEQEVASFHKRGECVAVDPPGINYNSAANLGM